MIDDSQAGVLELEEFLNSEIVVVLFLLLFDQAVTKLYTIPLLGRHPPVIIHIVLVVLFVSSCLVANLMRTPVCFTARNNMTEFWKEHSKDATVEEMMLDSRARELTQHELPEILSLLPSLAGSRVLELGAGIG